MRHFSSDLSERDVCDIITIEVSRFIIDDLSGIINTVKDELILAMASASGFYKPSWRLVSHGLVRSPSRNLMLVGLHGS